MVLAVARGHRVTFEDALDSVDVALSIRRSWRPSVLSAAVADGADVAAVRRHGRGGLGKGGALAALRCAWFAGRAS